MLPEDVRALALLLPRVIEGVHMGHPDFRVGGRIFATIWTDEDRVVVKLRPDLQAHLTESEPDVFEAIAGSWGARGWTNIDLTTTDEEQLQSALLAAWSAVAPAGLAAMYVPADER